ncbi:MAG TPA: NAD(P)-binding domain-containing protein [Streptosporangiaceae bacterium]|nr:NAD(P)-binding domain-containing protein [Streptosporangiaceae bacterium]
MEGVCVIGAGSSGIAACVALQAHGITFDCYETGSAVGGNWRYDNDNGMSSAYRSLHSKSSKLGMQYASLPMPDGYPDYLSHLEITRYLDDFVDHFGFRARIQFGTEVIWVQPDGDGRWDVTVRRRDTGVTLTKRYVAVLVANGHHWDPRYPEPAFPGAGEFTGTQMHSHSYRAPEQFAGKRLVVLGLGNSACDIAADCAPVAERTLLAMRRGAHVVPKYLFGTPIDHLTLMRLGSRAPLRAQSAAVSLLVRLAHGKCSRYGLPKPDHRMLYAPPAISDTLLSRVDQGDIVVKPTIAAFDGDIVRFTDGSAERADVVIYCTGYKISFPFLDRALLDAGNGEVPLYRRVVPPALPGLYFIGLVQPIGAIMPIAELQALWVADLLDGRASLPPQATMRREIARYRRLTVNRYGPGARHAISVDFLPYCREIARERRAGARRATRVARAARADRAARAARAGNWSDAAVDSARRRAS